MEKSAQRDAWIVLATVFVSMFIVFGIRLSYTVFFAAFTLEQGWSREASAGIFSVSMITFALASVPSGMALDRYGPRRVFSVGAAFMAVGLWLCSLANEIWQIAIAYGVIAGMGITILGLGGQGAVVSLWFRNRRGLAIGIAFAGTGLGSLIFTPLVDLLIRQFGWRGAHAVLALICAAMLLPVIVAGHRPLGDHEKRTRRIPVRGQDGILRSPIFWALMVMSFGALGPLRSLTVHQVAYMQDLGYERYHASAFVGLAGMLTAVAYILWGPISDRIGRYKTFFLGSLFLVGAVVIFFALGHTTNRSDLYLLAYAICYALAEGTRSSQPTAIATDAFQGRIGFVTGAVGAMFGLGAAFGPWLVGYLFDLTHSYEPGFDAILVMVAISVIGALAVGWFKRHSAKTVHPPRAIKQEV